MGMGPVSGAVATYRSWVFETDAPLDAFRYWFHRYLGDAGWSLDEASVYDREARNGGTRVHLRLTYHEDGVLLEAKIRTGLVRGSARGAADDLVEAGRRAQMQIQDRTEGPPSAGAGPNG